VRPFAWTAWGSLQCGKNRRRIPEARRAACEDRNIRVDMRIEQKFQEYIRSDSYASLITEGLLGNRYVDIDRGFVGRKLENEDEIPGREEKAIKEVVQRSAGSDDELF